MLVEYYRNSYNDIMRSFEHISIGRMEFACCRCRLNQERKSLLQLGEQLIKNENIAILELVKNAYDADAKKVVVNMRSIDSKDIGYIEIHDDGCGMRYEHNQGYLDG